MIVQKILDRKKEYGEQLVESEGFLQGGSGKRIRSLLFYMFSDPQKLTKKHHETIGIIETIHNASIMHDDVIDMNPSRRGEDSICKSKGSKMGILTGDFLIINSIKRFLKLHENDKFARKYFLRECHSTAYGALCEQNLNQSRDPPSIQEYLRMASIKTSPLFKLSCLFGAYLSGKPFEECKKAAILGVCFGILYQIQNDMDSYAVVDCRDSEDYTQKNVTLPIVILCKEFEFSLKEFRSTRTQEFFEKMKKKLNSQEFQTFIKGQLKRYDKSFLPLLKTSL